ncbi:hypothetical protein FNU79_11125 [Deinococcus detaillensis]|uniref:DUF3108 domain-containing protein n=1 Tax=Deinococcus detaillensis TaxID=2592048 RepID=A0A553UWC1_9DEIO|nr:hypothetical protein [Deinococcus detaillensis]TSA84504.1 hypothetical protein FNU79_11125 [Deinococcus detaillensis]
MRFENAPSCPVQRPQSPRPLVLRASAVCAGALGFLSVGSALAGACDHPYFANAGTFTYRTTAAGQVITTTSTIKLSGNTVTVNGETSGQAYNVVYDCRGGQISVRAGSQQKTAMIMSSVPPASQWKNGFVWKSAATIGSMTSQTTNRIVGSEQVTTPAGTFQALKVQSITSLDMSKMFKGQKVPPEMAKSMKDVQTTAWYAKGVGVVKQVSPNSSLELIKVSR